ncbi:replication initiator protein [Sigmofec virus UA08Rod_5342]|uniref:Replication initiator protein n=1 Tax=Sigmofec virus UA08Rod_5342 TaxID=2929420 RepID=A0A976N0T8_9VIRU|nr:replication initiator protein [Sigmofec virus UA08Rod_5342]
MCFFPNPNLDVTGRAYSRGITEFECGGCPECLRKRASRNMLRDYYESLSHVDNCMCTLTYDSYVRDSAGRIVGEKVCDRSVDLKDVQKFIKRLRMYVLRHYGVKFKYRVSAEYGKRTHRPHYHCLFFGWTFPDCTFYKLSKRNHPIYKSALLTKIWKHGICTVDSVRLTPAASRYCSKYTAKNFGAEDTFSVCSHGIGRESLYKAFNGRSYFIDGHEYPIPRDIWQLYIEDCYAGRYHFSAKYVNKTAESLMNGSYEFSRRQRRKYQIIRDHDPLYQSYLQYWKDRALDFRRAEKPVFERISLLPNDKFFSYKQQAISCLQARLSVNPYFVAPRSSCRSAAERFSEQRYKRLGIVICPINSRHNRANDTFSPKDIFLRHLFRTAKLDVGFNPFDECHKFLPSVQMSFFDIEGGV